MAKVRDYARYVRSKNAGPFWVTAEIFFTDEKNYTLVKNAKNINATTIAKLYNTKEALVKTYYCDSIHVIKFSWPRQHPSGFKNEYDMHFGQQYVFLANTEVEV
ncbi:MAG: DUF4387 family protein [Sphaerochaetaceae bacterium]